MTVRKKLSIQIKLYLKIIMSGDFKNLPQKYLQSNPNKALTQPSQIFAITTQEFTIGRTHENTLQILDNTISKKHAKIILLKGLNYLYDLQSANGVYVNGERISSQVHLEDGDNIQFGKYPCLYRFFDRNIAKNKSRGKGKINLKDYLFQQNPGHSKGNKFYNSAGIQNMQGQQSVLTQPISQGKIAGQGSGLNKKKSKVKQAKIRIPDIADYLKLAGNEQLGGNQTKINVRQISPKQKYSRNQKNVRKQGKIKLESLEEQIPSDQDLKQYNLQKREKNIYLQEQQAYQKIQNQKRKIQQQKLRKQLQQAKIAQDLLQKQLLLEQKVRQQQQKVQRQKQRLQQQFVKRQQMKRQEQLQKIKQMENKQRQMMSKIQQQRNKQLQQLKAKQQMIKKQSENSYKKQYEKRKKQLQIQAEALARQYENIYRETIKKVRTQIDNQQNTIQKMQKKQQLLQKQSHQLSQIIEQLQKELGVNKNKFIQVSGRNKACVLYASDIQDKIDGLGNKQFMEQKQGYYSKNSKSQAMKKLQDSVVNSRKLLKIKLKQYENIIEQITAINATIKQRQYASSSDVSDFLDTVYENLQTIQTLKQQYLQLIQSQRAVQQIWDIQLQENSQLQNANKALQNQVIKNIRQIDDNSRDQIRKSTQQRLHMIKIMHFCPQNKKTAAKFLIEQMLNLQQEVHKIRMNNQQIHKKIGKIIAQTQKVKRQNEYLSEILFSQDQNGHHFDNMKIVINNLMGKIEQQRNIDNVKDCLKLTKQADKFQLMIQNQLERKKHLRQNMRKIGQMGLAPGQIKISQKNPLTFFGDILTSKQIQIQKRKAAINHLQNQSSIVKTQIKLLQEKRQKISQALQKYKVQQISQAKRYLGRNGSR